MWKLPPGLTVKQVRPGGSSSVRERCEALRLRYHRGLDAWFRDAYYISKNVMEEPVESALTTKGQATIPKAIREHLGLKSGDRVKFFIHPDGSVVLLPKRSASVLRGIVKPRRRRTSIEEMSEAAAAGAAADAQTRRR